MFKRIIIFSLLCEMSNLHAGSVYESNLCGAKPIDEKEIKESKEKSRILESRMPPVVNQSPAQWCFGFAATDAINYNNYIQTNLQKGKVGYYDFYTSKNMISPIDTVYASQLFNDKNTYPLPKVLGRLNMKVGGIPFDAYAGVQMMTYKMRSAEQISFDSNEESNPATKKFVQAIMDEYKKRTDLVSTKNYNFGGIICPAVIYEHPSFQLQLNNFRQINSWLATTAEYNNWKVSEHVIDNYGAISDLKGPKDIEVYPYVNNGYSGNFGSQFYSKLKSALYPKEGYGSPVTIGICSNDLEDYLTSTPDSGKCNEHAVNVVGAFYENGECMVRIRNTWGKNWNGDGHITLPLDKLDESLIKFKKTFGTDAIYKASWITPEVVPAPANPRTARFDGLKKTIGEYKRQYKKSGDPYAEEWKNSSKSYEKLFED